MRSFIFALGHQPAAEVSATTVYDRALADADLAEELGYDGVWVAEHHFSSYCIIPNPLTLVAALSQRTNRIRIGSAVVVVPLHNPVRVAEELAMNDQLSGGRLEAILGRGFQPLEFDGLGIPFDESLARHIEGTEIVSGLLHEQDFAYEGKHFNFPPLTVLPRPYQRPAPPLWLACGSPGSVDVAVEKGMNVALTAGVDGLGKLTGLRTAFEESCAKHGRAVDSLRFAVQCSAHVTADPAQAEYAVQQALTVHRLGNELRHNRQQISGGRLRDPGPSGDEPDTETVLSSTLIGDEARVRDQVAMLHEVGISDLFMNFRFGALDDDGVRASMETMAKVLEHETIDA